MAGIDINLNLKTINGEPITGTGDIAVNSLNWRGEFASAPSMPVKNDAYHNTTIGNSYIYNGSVWNIFTQKGEAGENGSNEMLFPHETLTGADIGKLVIWKDGKAQLPVFEEAVDAVFQTYDFELNLGGFNPFTKPTVTAVFSGNPTNGYVFGNYTFMTTPSGSYEVQIEGTLNDTLAAFVVKMTTSTSIYTVSKPNSSTLVITYHGDGITTGSSYLGFNENPLGLYMAGILNTATAVTVTAEDRLGDSLIPFLFVWSLGVLGEDMGAAYLSFYKGKVSFTDQIKLSDGYDGSVPSDLSELKAGIIEVLEDIESITASWDGDVLSIQTDLELALEIDMSSYSTYWNDAFEDGVISDEGSSGIPSYCKYPILGLVKSVAISEVEIHTEPICEFKSIHEGVVAWEELLSFNRMFVLNPDAPGYLMPFITFLEGNYNIVDVLAIVAGGYVNAIENDIETNTTFFGAFSLDIFAVKLIVDIFLSGE